MDVTVMPSQTTTLYHSVCRLCDSSLRLSGLARVLVRVCILNLFVGGARLATLMDLPRARDMPATGFIFERLALLRAHTIFLCTT